MFEINEKLQILQDSQKDGDFIIQIYVRIVCPLCVVLAVFISQIFMFCSDEAMGLFSLTLSLSLSSCIIECGCFAVGGSVFFSSSLLCGGCNCFALNISTAKSTGAHTPSLSRCTVR